MSDTLHCKSHTRATIEQAKTISRTRYFTANMHTPASHTWKSSHIFCCVASNCAVTAFSCATDTSARCACTPASHRGAASRTAAHCCSTAATRELSACRVARVSAPSCCTSCGGWVGRADGPNERRVGRNVKSISRTRAVEPRPENKHTPRLEKREYIIGIKVRNEFAKSAHANDCIETRR